MRGGRGGRGSGREGEMGKGRGGGTAGGGEGGRGGREGDRERVHLFVYLCVSGFCIQHLDLHTSPSNPPSPLVPQVLETIGALARAVKAVSIIIRLEGGVPPLCQVVASNSSKLSYQRTGFACIAGEFSSPPPSPSPSASLFP